MIFLYTCCYTVTELPFYSYIYMIYFTYSWINKGLLHFFYPASSSVQICCVFFLICTSSAIVNNRLRSSFSQYVWLPKLCTKTGTPLWMSWNVGYCLRQIYEWTLYRSICTMWNVKFMSINLLEWNIILWNVMDQYLYHRS